MPHRINQVMNLHQSDLHALLRSNHPAKKYLILAAFGMGLGVFKGKATGFAWLAVGGASLALAIQELSRTNGLHGGNFHGYNRPPSRKIEESVALM